MIFTALHLKELILKNSIFIPEGFFCHLDLCCVTEKQVEQSLDNRCILT